MVEVVLDGTDVGSGAVVLVVEGVTGIVVDDGGVVGDAAGPSTRGAVVEGAVDEGAVVADGLSGEVHPVGGVDEPDWPGIRTIPAHPKLENSASLCSVEPSAKWSVVSVRRMNPAASTDTRTVDPV